LDNVAYTSIPLYIRGGSVLPLRVSSANTTTELRKQNFNLVIAPGLDGTASGSLYLDDGVSIVQAATSLISFTYTQKSTSGVSTDAKGGPSYGAGTLTMSGSFAYNAGVYIEKITLLGVGSKRTGAAPKTAEGVVPEYDDDMGVLTYAVNAEMTGEMNMQVGW
jgi:alpha-glucosidase